jgi:hemerythrin-like domain-containing protein
MADQAAHSDDEGVTAPEDLMKEHGVLNRCLLVNEEAIRRVEARQEVAPDVFRQTAGIVRHFVEEYHERKRGELHLPGVSQSREADRLGGRMEEDEHEVLGDEGFEKNVAAVEAIEKTLGIYALAQFTPKL